MCEHCEYSNVDAHLFMKKTKVGSIAASIINGYIVVVSFVGEICDTAFKEISFCPMCGRDLRGGE